MKRIILYSLLMGIIMPFNSCRKFLDEKSRDKLAIPTTIRDAQALLDNYQLEVLTRPLANAISDDDYYLSDSYYNTLSTQLKDMYRWDKNAILPTDWKFLYQNILAANTAIETLEKIEPETSELEAWNKAKGGAHFLRAYNLLDLVQLYAKPYSKETVSYPGVPLRLTSSINEIIQRPSLEDSYRQIERDFKVAALYLPISNTPPTRPVLSSAYAALARLYLVMGDYKHAEEYADSSLKLYNTLIDFNTVNASSSTPFTRFNPEVLFQACLQSTSINNMNNWRVDSALFKLYHVNDLRRTIYYQPNGTGTYGFKGSYDGNTTTAHFSGLATDEVYLVKAESLARLGMKDSALAYLNKLLVKRWKTGTFIPFTALTADEALKIILMERRKELVSRGIRWYDLRRLNLDPRFSKTLERKINGQVYELAPNDPRYTQYIPFEVVAIAGIQQNQR